MAEELEYLQLSKKDKKSKQANKIIKTEISFRKDNKIHVDEGNWIYGLP